MNTLNTPTTSYNEANINRVSLNDKASNEWLEACSEEVEANQMDELWSIE